jgi:hypothetical protein
VANILGESENTKISETNESGKDEERKGSITDRNGLNQDFFMQLK